MGDGPITLVLVARVPVAGVADFQAYENAVLPLLAEHGGTLERRLRGSEATVEIHVVRFTDAAALDRYRQDPRRAAHAALLERSGASMELLHMTDVT